MELLLPLLIVFMIGMIFVSNRQRKKQAAQQESLQSALAVGDIVVMTSGISGTVVDVDDERTIDVEIAPEVVTTWLRAAVREKIGGEGVPVGTDPDLAETHTAEAHTTESHESHTAGAPATGADAPDGSPAGEAAPTAVPAPALEADRADTGTEHTAEGTPSARADEPTDTPSTSGARRP